MSAAPGRRRSRLPSDVVTRPIAPRGALFAALLLLVVVPGAAQGRARPPALYIAPAGTDMGRCTAARPCAGFDRAYALARPGATVYVAPGRYGAETILPRAGRTRPKVVFRPAGKGPVTVTGELKVAASHLELRDMTLNDLELPREAHDVTLRNIRNHGFWMQGPTNITFVGGEVTCGVCPFHPHIDDGGAPDYRPPRNIVFDGVRFHDWQSASPDQHTECLQILAGDGITIRNSVFRECATAHDGRGATANLHVSWLGNGPKTRNILIENNFFYRSGNTYAIQTGDYTGLRIRYNSVAGPIGLFGGWGEGKPVEITGNVMGFDGCKLQQSGPGRVSPVVYRYNVLDGGTCDRTDVDAPSGFVDAKRDLHLRPDAAAIGRGDPRRFPRSDIDGSRRPKGGRPDAGADEAR